MEYTLFKKNGYYYNNYWVKVGVIKHSDGCIAAVKEYCEKENIIQPKE